MTTTQEPLDIAIKAVEIYASTHPRPAHVTQRQAAQMLSVSEPTVRKLIRAGKIRLNQCGLVPITEIDRALA
jgi:plasmid maintenance system antidote protein VapI